MAIGSFPLCSPPLPKKMPLNQTPCSRDHRAADCALQAGSCEGALPGFQEHLGQSEGALRSNRFSVELHVQPRKTPGQMLPKPQIS